jgi:hypothetical protein
MSMPPAESPAKLIFAKFLLDAFQHWNGPELTLSGDLVLRRCCTVVTTCRCWVGYGEPGQTPGSTVQHP